MQEPDRFKKAYQNLINTHQNNYLDWFSANNCPVGAICNNQREWSDVIISFENINYHNKKGLKIIEESGYSIHELMMIEKYICQNLPKHRFNIFNNSNKILKLAVKCLCMIDNLNFYYYKKQLNKLWI